MSFDGNKRGILIKRISIREFKDEDGNFFTVPKYGMVKTRESVIVGFREYFRERYFVSKTDNNSTEDIDDVKYTNNSAGDWVNFDDPNLNFGDIWIPHPGTEFNIKFNLLEMQKDGGRKYLTTKGINSTYLSLSLVFSDIGDIECKSLVAFNEFFSTLLNRFYYQLPDPYDYKGVFQINKDGFTHIENAYNRNTIQLEFVQSFNTRQMFNKSYDFLESYLP